MSVQVEDQIDADVRHAGRDDQRFVRMVGNDDVRIAVFDCLNEFYMIGNFDLVGNNVLYIALVTAARRGHFFGKTAVCEGYPQRRDDESDKEQFQQ